MRTTFVHIVLFAYIFLLPQFTFAEEIKFHSLTVNQALTQAEHEGKNVFISFEADWCLPCQIMEESVFADKEVISVLNNNFISVKADYDELEYQEWFGKYAVTNLPTMSIIDHVGLELDRREGTMKQRDFLSFLRANIKKEVSNIERKIEISEQYTSMPLESTKLATIQFGAFSKFSNAEILSKKVSSLLNVNAFITKDEKDLYRVVYSESISDQTLKEIIASARTNEIDFFVKK